MIPLCHIQNCPNEATKRKSSRFRVCTQHFLQQRNERAKANIYTKPGRKPAYTKRKATGEAKIFSEIWNERRHESEISGTPLGDELKAHYCIHVLPKSVFSRWRLKKKNIVLGTLAEHTSYDTEAKEVALRKHPGLQWVYQLKEEYKVQYEMELRREIKKMEGR